MILDQTTYHDLSIFHQEMEQSIFHKIDLTHTVEGRAWLHQYFKEPFSSLKKIEDTQNTLQRLINQIDLWPTSITNGTLMVIEKYFESQIDTMPENGHIANAWFYKIFHGPDYALTRYSLEHFAAFFRGLQQLVVIFPVENRSALTSPLLEKMERLMKEPLIQAMAAREPQTLFTPTEVVLYGKFIKEHYKAESLELINLFGRFDAWQAMASAMIRYQLSFPEFTESNKPLLEIEQLFHILLPEAVPYNVHMNRDSNFIFLTGANMAGKSTFIKSVGSAVFLAHLGMGVPAKQMKLSLFDGLLSNINVVDNIIKGESYFFNEVQRIKNTILKINNGRKWLVLIDELFKGTNVQDAMKCSSAVIKGLIKIDNSLFILSTHLYEIGEELKVYPNISFRYFETTVTDEQLCFSYQLKEGISNDRLGYLILKREKVVELLEQL